MNILFAILPKYLAQIDIIQIESAFWRNVELGCRLYKT